MQITPIEIRKKKFEKRFRGYHPDEVDDFLYSLSYAWEKITIQANELQLMLEDHKKEISRLQDLEGALVRTIQDAEATAGNILTQAKKEGELAIQAANIEKEKLLQEAYNKAKVIEVNSMNEAAQLKCHMDKQLAETKQAIQEATASRDTLIQQLRQLAEDILASSRAIQPVYQPKIVTTEHQKIALSHDSDKL